MGEANKDLRGAPLPASTNTRSESSESHRRADPQISHMWADDPDNPSVPPLAEGEIIDERYRIESLLGAGGMGTVYKATQLDTGATVALKLMLPRLAAEVTARRRFEREAQAILRMDHQNFVKILDYGERPPHTPYLVMEYLEGAVLREVMDSDEPLTCARSLEIVRGVLQGLGHAHARGVIHRDIKPENVFMVDQPEGPAVPKLLDLGLAKLVSTDDTSTPYKLTMRGAVFGTPGYMAPEQATGDEVDGRADLYSVTVMLYEMLTGQRPFIARDPPALLVMHTRKTPPPLASKAPFLADYESLQELVSHGLTKLPRLRIASAEAYIEALDPVHEELLASPPWLDPSMSSEIGDLGGLGDGAGEVVTSAGIGTDSTALVEELLTHSPTRLRASLSMLAALVLVVALLWWLAS